jgi:hypothetical protein
VTPPTVHAGASQNASSGGSRRDANSVDSRIPPAEKKQTSQNRALPSPFPEQKRRECRPRRLLPSASGSQRACRRPASGRPSNQFRCAVRVAALHQKGQCGEGHPDGRSFGKGAAVSYALPGMDASRSRRRPGRRGAQCSFSESRCLLASDVMARSEFCSGQQVGSTDNQLSLVSHLLLARCRAPQKSGLRVRTAAIAGPVKATA